MAYSFLIHPIAMIAWAGCSSFDFSKDRRACAQHPASTTRVPNLFSSKKMS